MAQEPLSPSPRLSARRCRRMRLCGLVHRRDGQRLIHVEAAVLDRLTATRTPGKVYTANGGARRLSTAKLDSFRAEDQAVLRAGLTDASAPASASPSRGPGNGILWAETGGRFRPQNAGERPEFGSQTATRLTNRPELRGFLPPGNRVGLPVLYGGGRSRAKPVSATALA